MKKVDFPRYPVLPLNILRQKKEVRKPIDPDQTYIVATNDFLAVGGDGYKAFGEAIKSSRDFPAIGGMMKGEKVVYSDSSRWVRDVVVEYIKEKKRIAPAMEGRIIEIR
jgi:2',3'-cyclic-nucleotide 2'-phosphodiesterase (5'-nucleotidase family)